MSQRPWLPLAEHPRFRWLWLGNALSLLGSQIGRIGLLLYVVRVHGDVADVAALVAVETLPGALAAPVVGAWVDRLGPRRLLVIADLVRAVCVLGILASPTTGVILPMMAISSVATVVFQSAKGAAIPRLVPAEALPAANGIDRGASSLMWVIGPAVGAMLLTTLGLAPTLWIDAASFLVSACLVAAVRLGPAESARDPERASIRAQIVDGWRCLAAEKRVLLMNGQLFVALICTGLWLPLAPFFLRDHLGAPEPALGWQIAFFGAGSVAGALLAPSVVRWLGQGRSVLVGLIAEATVMCIYALTPQLHWSSSVLFVWGLAVSLVAVPFQSLCQALVEERFLGRVFALVQQVENLALVLATVLAVALAELWTSPRILLVAGLVYLSIAFVSARSDTGRALALTP